MKKPYVSDPLFGSVAPEAAGQVIASATATRNRSVKGRFIVCLLCSPPEQTIMTPLTMPCNSRAYRVTFAANCGEGR